MTATSSSTSTDERGPRLTARPRTGAPAHADDVGRPAEAGSNQSRERSQAAMPPLRKAAIVLVSLEQSLASQLLAHLDRSSVEAVTWEIARLERVDPVEQAAVLDEFLALGLRRLCFVFEDLHRMSDDDLRGAY